MGGLGCGFKLSFFFRDEGRLRKKIKNKKYTRTG